ncbi:hypothetical protein BS17DRAFT_179201 [Gyrodon lividus]|nr:hypothetical protein BS17DRAFT_179201 [Gyrodon lividus]
MQHSPSPVHDPDTKNAPPESLLRPGPTPLSSHRPPPRPQPGQSGPVPRNTLSGLLSNRAGNAPIPPSLQAKMTAMLNRGSATPPGSVSFSVDSAAQALQRSTISEAARPLTHEPNSSPSLTATRGRGAGHTPTIKRNKPGLKLSDINSDAVIGAANAGLGAGRPSLAEAGRRPPSTFDTPFANFNKIV